MASARPSGSPGLTTIPQPLIRTKLPTSSTSLTTMGRPQAMYSKTFRGEALRFRARGATATSLAPIISGIRS